MPDAVRTDVQCEVSDQLDMRPDCVVSPKAGGAVRSRAPLWCVGAAGPSWAPGCRDVMTGCYIPGATLDRRVGNAGC